MLNITNLQGNANPNHNEMSPTRHQSVRMASTKRQEIISVGEDVEKREHLYTAGGNVNWYSHCGEEYGGSSKN